jgi:hypothetical protein
VNGVCAGTEVGDRVPRDASLFSFPTTERWGLVWAFNGTTPTYEVPGWPENESERYFRVVLAADYCGDPFISSLNVIDVQHIRSLHGFDINDVEVTTDTNSFHVDMTLSSEAFNLAPISRHAELIATNAVVYSGTSSGIDSMAAAVPYNGRTRLYIVTGGLRAVLPADTIEQQVAEREQVSISAIEQDLPVLEHIRFQADTFTTSDRGLVPFLQFAVGYPRAHPSQAYIR